VLVPTLLGALAVVGGSTALFPLMEGTSWMLSLVEVVAVVWLVGVATRTLAVPAWGVGLLQLAGLLIALTSLFTTTGVLGVLPGPAAFSEGARLLGGAWRQILTTVPPAPDTPQLGLLICLSIGGLALVVDVLIAGVRVPALVALPLLSLYSVPASIDTRMLPWYAFAIPAALFAALLVVAGHTGWQPARRAQASMATSATAITALAIVAALVLAALATPIGTAGRLPRGGHGGDVGLNPWALLHGDLTNRSPEDTLTVTGLDDPAYLRTLALEQWTPDEGFTLGPVAGDDPDLDGAIPGAPAPNDSSVTVTVTPQKYRDAYLPIYSRSTKVTGLATGWDYDRDLQTVFRDDKVVPQQYTVTANIAPVPTEQLEDDTVQSGGALTETGDLPTAVVAKARAITADAHTPFDAAQDLLHFFTDPKNGFTYSLRVPTGNSGSALEDFLTGKQGYCEQYAAAMAIMLRSLGIPSRVAIGFTQGTQESDGSYQIVSTDAHAWVEVKFDKSGWVAFDPTPVVGGQGGLQGFDTGAGGGGQAPGTGTAKTTTTSPFPSSLDGAAITTRAQIPGWEPTYGLGGGTVDTSSIWGWLTPVLIAVAAVLLLVMLIAAPSWIRRRRRRRRLAVASAGRAGAGSAAWEEITDTLTDHGIAMHDVESARVTANRLARTAHLSTTGREDLRTVVMTAEREWYGKPSESEAGTSPDLMPGVQAVVEGLERSAPRPWVDRLLPRSMRIGGRRAR